MRRAETDFVDSGVRVATADFNLDGFVNALDYDAFAEEFEN